MRLQTKKTHTFFVCFFVPVQLLLSSPGGGVLGGPKNQLGLTARPPVSAGHGGRGNIGSIDLQEDGG